MTMYRVALAAAVLTLLAQLGCDGASGPPTTAAPAVATSPSATAGAGPIRAPAPLASHDALHASGVAQAFAPALATSPLVATGWDLHLEPALGQPTFLWAAARAPRSPSLKGQHPADAALAHVRTYAHLYRLKDADVAAAIVDTIHDTGTGAIIVAFRQELDGVELFHRELRVIMRRDRELVALAGNLAPDASGRRAGAFALPGEAAVAQALQDLGGVAVDVTELRAVATPAYGYRYVDLARPRTDVELPRPARLKPVLYELGDRLEPGYYVELSLADPGSVDALHYAYVVSAVDGRVLFRGNLTARDQFTYRVWADATSPFMPYDGPQGNGGSPHPTGLRDGYQAALLPPVDVTLQNSPFTYNDPWLPAGATTTVGNNVDAYVDLSAPDGYSAPQGDFRASTTGTGAFQRTFDFTVAPTSTAQRMAALTHLFYLNNFLHDWYYDAGFDEASRNAQTNNFGRGGAGGDALLAEGQDYSGTDNANMTTPADGSSPKMQMYLWAGNPLRYVDVNAPAVIAGRDAAGVAEFGPQSFNVTGNVVATLPADACANLTNGAALAGKIALIDRGTCNFSDKTWRAQQANAIGVVIVNNTPAAPDEVIDMAVGTTPHTFTIPTEMISYNHGAAIKTQLAVPTTVNVTMFRDVAIQRDSGLDSTVVAHEWGHYISNRLIGNGSGLTTNQSGGMGEGWGDFHALLLVVKPEDISVPANANWNGVYAAAAYLASGYGNDGQPGQGYYFGIRRGPYSTDRTKNALTFKHITDGVALPAGVPVAFGADGADNSEVHNTGEVWATMLWECYAGLLRDSSRLTFDQARDRMKRYLVAAYKGSTNINPTFVEARDALIAVSRAQDRLDCQVFGSAFASRGIGAGAVAPARTSTNNAGVVESYVPLCQNGIPTAKAGADQSVNERTLVTLDGSGSSDPDLDPLTYAWTQTGGPTVTLSSTTAQKPTFTAPDVTTAGATLTFSLVVTDSLGAMSTPATTHVTVNNVNRAPTANAGPDQTVDERSTATLDGSASSDPDGDTFTYAWSQTGGTTVTLSDVHAQKPTFPTGEVTSDTLLTFSLVVTDPLGAASAAATTHVTIRDVNRAPVANAGTSQTVDERSTATLDGSASSDPDGDTFTYAWSQTGGPAVALSDATAQKPTFPTGEVAADTLLTFSLIVTDVHGLASTAATTQVTIRNVNRAPVANAGASQTVDERTTVTLDGSGSTDPDGEALAYAWTQTGGTAVVLSDATAQKPTFTAPDVPAAGDVLTFALVVSDPHGAASAAATTQVTVHNVNRAPVANAGAPQTVDERTTVTLDGSGSTDPDGDPLTYAWTQTGGTTVTLSDATAQKPTFTAPDVPAAGATLTFSLVVTDPLGLASAAATTQVTVENVNRAPVANAGADQTVAERTTVTLDGSGSSDPDGDALAYAWTQTGGTTVTLSDATAQKPTFTAPDVTTAGGTLTFSLVVTDPQGTASAAATTHVTVTNVNRAPVADAGTDQAALQGATVTLDGSGSSDPDGDTLTYAWAQTGGTTVTLSDATAQKPTFTAPTITGDTILTFTLQVSDGAVTSAAATTHVTIHLVNHAPTAEAGADQSVAEGATVTLDGSGSTDPDGDTLTYAWTQTGGTSVTLSDATAQKPTFTAPSVTAATVLTFSLQVSDGIAASAADTMQVTVHHGNGAPVADAGPDQTVDEGDVVALDGSGSTDPDGDTLTYTWTQTSGTAVTLDDEHAAAPTFTAPQVTADETLLFSLVVSDGALDSDAATVQITVRDTTLPGTLQADAGPDQTALAGTIVVLAGSGYDPAGGTLSYAWTQLYDSDVTLTAADSHAPFFTAPKGISVARTLTFRLTVTSTSIDGYASDTVSITVLPDTASPASACGCHAADGSGGPAGLAVLAILGVLLQRRRSRRR
jgi:large repetitive protein